MNVPNFDVDLEEREASVAVSAVVVIEPGQSPIELLAGYRESLEGLGISYELISVIDGGDAALVERMRDMAGAWPQLTVLNKRPWRNEEAALAVAAKRVKGDLVLTLSGWPEIAARDIVKLIEGLGDNDVAVATRADRGDPRAQGLRTRVLHATLSGLFGYSVPDVFCRVRLMRREVLEDAASFGVRQHFIPTIASERGYAVTEVTVDPVDAQQAVHTRFVFKPLGHIRALFDAVALYVVLKFLRRPLRFFGSIGLPILLLGLFATTVLVLGRLAGATALADRPALIFSVLMIVLGVQIIAMGLVGEIIIFANSRRMKQYMVKQILRKDPPE